MSLLQAVTVNATTVNAGQNVAVGTTAGDTLTIAAGTAGSSLVTLTATGVDTNININLITKGTGALWVNGVPLGGVSKLTLFYYSNRN